MHYYGNYENALLLIILLRISYPNRCMSLCHICNDVEGAGQIGLESPLYPSGGYKNVRHCEGLTTRIVVV